ncbi:SDR family NAD(P)-dependent oxidoreductase [Marinactinospora endophytica]
MSESSRPLAVVTGASSGIGEQYARRYAREGYALILVARSGKRLEAIREELGRLHDTEAQALVADLSTPEGVSRVADAIAGDLPRLDHLVNCAGVAYEGDLVRASRDELRQMIDLNVTALTELTRAAVVRMREQRSGTIVNVAAAAAYQPMPHLAAYAASKSYVLSFTEAVSEENREYGVRVIAVSPSGTDTPMNPGAGRGKRMPEQVVDTTWRALPGRAPSVVDGFANSVLAQLSSRLFPKRFGLRVAERMMRDRA